MAVDVAIDLPGADPGRMLQHEPDEALVAYVRAGHDAAFEAIYDRHHRGLIAFCRHLVWSREEAEDALQHTFAAAYRSLTGDGNPPLALKPWLYTIARNRCLTVLRARRTREGVDEPTDGAVVTGLADEVQQRSDLRDLVADLHRLPDDQRAALVLFELGDHSHAEIAAVLSVSREKVKALVFQAREGLLRARTARDTPCADIRRDLSSRSRALPRRGVIRGHLDRCAACAAFDLEVRRQRAALAIVMPVVPSLELKGSVLGPMLGGGATIAGGGATLASGGATVAGGGAVIAGGGGAGAGAAGFGAGAGASAGVAATGAGAAGGTGAAATGGVAALASSAGGIAGAASGLGALAAKSVVAKALTVVALATAAAGTTEVARTVADHTPAPVVSSATPAQVLAPQTTEPTATTALPATHTTIATTATPDPTATTASAPASSTGTSSTSTSAPAGSGSAAPAGTAPASSTPAAAPADPAADPATGGTAASTPPATADPAPAAGSGATTGAAAATSTNTVAPATNPSPTDSSVSPNPMPVVMVTDLPVDPTAADYPDGVTVLADPNNPTAPIACPAGLEPAPPNAAVDPAAVPDPAGAATSAAGPADPNAAPAALVCVPVATGALAAPDPASAAAPANTVATP